VDGVYDDDDQTYYQYLVISGVINNEAAGDDTTAQVEVPYTCGSFWETPNVDITTDASGTLYVTRT